MASWRRGFFARHPALTVGASLLIVGGLAALAVLDVVELREALGPRFGSRVELGVLAGIAWSIVLALALTLRTKQARAVSIFVGALWVVILGVPLIDLLSLYRRYGPDPIEEMDPAISVPRLVFLAWTLLAGLGGLLYAIPGYVRESRMLAAAERAVSVSDGHDIVVMDVRPDAEHEFPAYFVAQCGCGWLGDIRDRLDQAVADARTHDATREPPVIRSVG